MATGSGAGRIEKAQAQLLDGRKSDKRDTAFTGKVIVEGRKGENDQMYDSRRDIGTDKQGREVMTDEWTYKEGTQPRVKSRT